MIGPLGWCKSTLLRVVNRTSGIYPDQRATCAALLDGGSLQIFTAPGSPHPQNYVAGRFG